MRKMIVLITALFVSGAALCAVTKHFALDSRTGVRPAGTKETLYYDAAWTTGVVCTVSYSVEGTNGSTECVTGDKGGWTWTPSTVGAYTFTLTTKDAGGNVVGTGSARFVVGALATGLTAKQRYPWNGLVDITVTLTGASNDVMDVDCVFVATNSATHTALKVAHVTTVGGITGSGTTWTQKFVWDAKADVGAVKIGDVALTVDVLGGVQLWENGPFWAECNVGASQPEESGYYFWWGDTVGYKRNIQ